jgi:hypothetical protein
MFKDPSIVVDIQDNPGEGGWEMINKLHLVQLFCNLCSTSATCADKIGKDKSATCAVLLQLVQIR